VLTHHVNDFNKVLMISTSVGDNAVVDAIKLILLNYSNVSIAKIVVKKIERVKQP